MSDGGGEGDLDYCAVGAEFVCVGKEDPNNFKPSCSGGDCSCDVCCQVTAMPMTRILHGQPQQQPQLLGEQLHLGRQQKLNLANHDNNNNNNDNYSMAGNNNNYTRVHNNNFSMAIHNNNL